MDQNHLILLLVLLTAVHGIAQETFDYRISGILDNWNLDYEKTEEDFHVPMLKIDDIERSLVNVDSLGAVGDGIADDTQAFLSAWNITCSIPNSIFLVPENKNYLVKAARFKGPCAGSFIMQIAGTITAPDEPDDWDPKNPRNWLVFSKLNGVIFQGGGVIDGSGRKWWDSSCKRKKQKPCRSSSGPTAFTIDSSSSVRVRDLNIQNSQQMHFAISRSDAVRVSETQVTADENSPNTDGIHISGSTNVVIENCKIGTGDDCISIVSGSSNIKMKNIDCGPGHGISIGSLGKDNSTDVVSGIVLDTATLRGTTNGLRIKTWQGGSGYARAILFQNVEMQDVANPIIIDQFYCDSSNPCQNQTSAVEISQIMYINISGTSKTPHAMKFACSDTVPCKNIVLNNINLQGNNGTVETFCNSANGFNYGYVQPSAECLRYDKDPHLDSPGETETSLHTEL